MTFVPPAAGSGHRAVRVVLMGGIALVWWVGAGMSTTAHAAVPRSDAAGALVAFSGWVGRLPAEDEHAWQLRKLLAFYRARLGLWMEAELQASSSRLPAAQQFELGIMLARAARYAGEWDRARGWITAAGETLARVPEADRTWPALADYYGEVVALREIDDVRVPYAQLKEFLDGELPSADRFALYRSLVEMAVILEDKENYGKLATALLTTARAWQGEAAESSTGEASAADRAMTSLVDWLLRRGHAETVLGLLDIGIGDAELRRELTEAATYARVAQEADDQVLAYLSGQGALRERVDVLAAPDLTKAGLVVWLARWQRDDLAYEILAEVRDAPVQGLSEAVRGEITDTWNAAVRRTATEYFASGGGTEARRLGGLYVDARRGGAPAGGETDSKAAAKRAEEGALMELGDGLVAFATLLGQWGERDAARRLLLRLPFDYPRKEDVADSTPGERAMREQAVELAWRWKQAALVSAWAAAGELTRAQEAMNELPRENRTGAAVADALRPRLLAECAAAAAIEGAERRAADWIEEARLARPVALTPAADATLALIAALVLTGQPAEAWDELAALDWAAEAVVADVVTSVLHRGRAARAQEWLREAPEEFRREAWLTYFRIAVPDPAVSPLAPRD